MYVSMLGVREYTIQHGSKEELVSLIYMYVVCLSSPPPLPLPLEGEHNHKEEHMYIIDSIRWWNKSARL